MFDSFLLKFNQKDPVKSCPVYKNIGCTHVDGFLCDYPDCSMIEQYLIKNEYREMITNSDVDIKK